MADAVLVADIGGTNVRFALAEENEGVVSIRNMKAFHVDDYKSADAAAIAYLSNQSEKPRRAAFAAAAAPGGAEIKLTNAKWVLKPEEIKKALGLQSLTIVNDFYALAASIRHLDEQDFKVIRNGPGDPSAPKLVIGPGTGFGQALIVPVNESEKIISTEGGHVTFAPRTGEEFEIMKFVAMEHPRVSIERLISGQGIVSLYRALCAMNDAPERFRNARDITNAAVSDEDKLAVKTVNLFCAFLGRAAGDAVLATGARGGVYLGGGILPKMRKLFLTSKFFEEFIDKGRMRAYVETAPVRLIEKEGAALYGAAGEILFPKG
jgi:glucokinase